MTGAGLLLFPWDLQDEGIERVMGFAAGSGIETLYLASVYHAGCFLQPHNPARKVYVVEDGMCYFHPESARYGPIRPAVAQCARDTDWFAAAAASVPRFGLRLAAWTVTLHNSRLGAQHPEAVVRDVFGNRRPFALCPSHPEVRRYVRALVADLARYNLCGNLLEAFRYLDAVHGLHHERWSIPLPGLERRLFSFSFAPADLQTAAAAGIDGDRAQRAIREHLERFFEAYPEPVPSHPETLEEFEARHPEVGAYRRCLVAVLDSLLSEIAGDLGEHPPELIGQGLQDFNIASDPAHPAWSALMGAVYDMSEAEARVAIARAKHAARPGQKTYAALKLGFGAVRAAAELSDLVAAVCEAGADSVLFYNYAECPAKVLGWIGPALRAV